MDQDPLSRSPLPARKCLVSLSHWQTPNKQIRNDKFNVLMDQCATWNEEGLMTFRSWVKVETEAANGPDLARLVVTYSVILWWEKNEKTKQVP